MKIFQYSKNLYIKNFNPVVAEEEYLWKVIGKKNLHYEVELIEGHGVHETATYIDEDKPWFKAKNHIYIQDFGNEIKVTGGFIYDDEDIYHHYNEERKILIKLDIDKIINKKIDNLIKKLKKVKNEK